MALVTVSQLNNYIKRYIDHNVHLSDIWLKGEISNFKKHFSGHIYMTLKDESSSIKAVLFNSYAKKLSFIPSDGDKVIAYGKIGVFERDGIYQLYIEQLIADGIGELYATYENLKNQLESEGLFDTKYKKSIPKYPKSIGIITSISGAALRDIMNVITRRYRNADVYIYPAKVQGVDASDTLCEALEYFSEINLCDVLILARGGGSIEDLWAFNEEKTARAIFNCNVPVVTGIGHETDYTIADFVSDMRAPTPSAAAELVTPSATDMQENIKKFKNIIELYIKNYIDNLQNKLNDDIDTLFTQAKRLINDNSSKLENLKLQLSGLFTTLNVSTLEKLASLSSALNALSPKKVLERGYSIVVDFNDEPINLSIVKSGDYVNILHSKGNVKCKVLEVTNNET